MNRLSTEKRVQVVSALVEGVSINATCRMTGVAKHTTLESYCLICGMFVAASPRSLLVELAEWAHACPKSVSFRLPPDERQRQADESPRRTVFPGNSAPT